ncbi:cytochrome P450 [Penicillium macrosclerotiorum]|uniref:cytochrome P450 n=1 Tax=Penicillium macrosclerotiorum TaxID=303699 RepID=UPI00254966CD|nr:cytochrome P450 [Penicillium macrosclerotiorum]KAJ5676264.1 cytochrome P450 [Penicillium macrosclerotiorum]
MGTLSENISLYMHWSPFLILALICLKCVLAIIRAIKSPLSKIPGPWYAPLTTLHLKYAFARGTIWKNVEEAHLKYGSIFRLGPRQIWISDKEALKVILMTVDLPKVTISADMESFGSHSRPDPHKRLKKFLSPAFTIAYVDKLEFLFSKCVSDLISRYVDLLTCFPSSERKIPMTTDLMEDLHNLALDIMGECSFGNGFGQTNKNKNLELEFDEGVWKRIPMAIFRGMTRRYQFVYIKRLLRSLAFNVEFDWPREMIAAISAVADRRRAYPTNVRPDLLQHLLDNGERPDSGVKMGIREVIDQMAEILLAGSETTSGTIACFFLEVLRNPAVKEKLMTTLPVRNPNDPIISSKTVRMGPEYEYLEACIKEVLRLHPIASEMGRRIGNSPVELLGYYLPAHTIVSASYRQLHRNPQHWPEPLRFWPERWLEPRPHDVPAPDTHAYYPFSAGKHSCIGKNFAMAEIRMLTANILSRFDFDEVPGQNIDYRQYITMQFEHGSWKVYLKPRYLRS